jgi:hypothetical protein
VKRKGSDCISISPRSRRKAVIEKVTSDIVDRIIRKSPRDDSPHEICGQDEGLGGNGHPLKKEDSQLSFKLIDKEEGEVTKSISIEDSQFLKDQLEEDTRTKTGN